MNSVVSNTAALKLEESLLTPREIVAELDRYIIAQEEAKRAVAIALRNRWRRLKVEGPLKDEITPKNIIMIGPTGVGKTEISRRLAKLAKAPFVKVEASKFTEVGYVGRDVESIIRDLADIGYHMVKSEERERVKAKAETIVEEQLLDLLLPGSRTAAQITPSSSSSSLGHDAPYAHSEQVFFQDSEGVGHIEPEPLEKHGTREKFRDLLRSGKLDNRVVEIEVTRQMSTHMQILGPQGFGEIEGQLKDMFSNMIPKQKETRKVKIEEARQVPL